VIVLELNVAYIKRMITLVNLNLLVQVIKNVNLVGVVIQLPLLGNANQMEQYYPLVASLIYAIHLNGVLRVDLVKLKVI